jgi:hypothetical protein
MVRLLSLLLVLVIPGPLGLETATRPERATSPPAVNPGAPRSPSRSASPARGRRATPSVRTGRSLAPPPSATTGAVERDRPQAELRVATPAAPRRPETAGDEPPPGDPPSGRPCG